MELMVQRVTGRLKKYFLLLMSVPIFLGATGWLLPVGKGASIQTAEATISLGTYDNHDLNDSNNIITLLSNTSLLEEHMSDLTEGELEDMLSKVKLTPVSEKLLTLSYTDASTANPVKVVNKLCDAILKIDNESFQQRKLVIEDSIRAVQKEPIGEEAKVDKLRFLYELNTDLIMLNPATLIKPAEIQGVEDKALSSRDRAVLGFLLGVTIVFLWIVIPEFFRKQ